MHVKRFSTSHSEQRFYRSCFVITRDLLLFCDSSITFRQRSALLSFSPLSGFQTCPSIGSWCMSRLCWHSSSQTVSVRTSFDISMRSLSHKGNGDL